MTRDIQISRFLQEQLRARDRSEVSAVDAARWLDEAGLLSDEPARPGKPLRGLLRAGRIDGAEQRPPVRNGRWFIVRTEGAVGPRHEPFIPGSAAGPKRGDADEFETARESYRPERVRLLFVGESRPAGGTFFYLGNSILFEATREAFARAHPATPAGVDFLAFFRDADCYLEDLCPEPVNRFSESDREAARRRAIPQFAERLVGLNPELVIVVMKAIRTHVAEALHLAGLTETPVRSLPFPRREWRGRYVAELAELLTDGPNSAGR